MQKKPSVRREVPARRRDVGRARGAPIADAILEHALDELLEHGVASLSVDRIARAAEVNKTSIYRRWPTREALIEAALARVLSELSLQLEDTGSLRGDLVAMVTTVARFMESPRGRALSRATLGASSDRPLMGVPTEGDGVAGAATLFARAVARGEWRTDADPTVVLPALLGAITQRVIVERQDPTHAWAAALVDLFVRAVAPTHRPATEA